MTEAFTNSTDANAKGAKLTSYPHRGRRWRRYLPDLITLVLFAALPLVLGARSTLGGSITDLFIFAILALGLNVVVGYAGLLHLGIAAFFGIGAYIMGILTVSAYPFQLSFSVALVLATIGSALAGLVLAAPTIRLQGDYLALVTLGFGEVVNVALKNLDNITGGMKTLNPLPPPKVPEWLAWILHKGVDFSDYRMFYFLALAILVAVVLLLRNLENSRLGRPGWRFAKMSWPPRAWGSMPRARSFPHLL